MEEVGYLSYQGQQLWQSILDTTIHKPAPMTCFDAFFHLALIVTLRGTQQVVDYYEMLLLELEQRVAYGIGMVPNEKYRILWDNLPVWYKTRWFSNKFASHNASLVADTYTSGWCSSLQYLNPKNFLASMAEAYTRIFLNCGIDKMAENIIVMAEKYQVNGLVMHSNRSCKPYSFSQYDIQKIVLKELGLPTLIFEADMADERIFSESQIDTRIEAFMEMLL
jgi:benzoyl-CoA reductase/2-hydroxyglutaryl-CoA dehydratase subunit BcrC/BadD/HgdB